MPARISNHDELVTWLHAKVRIPEARDLVVLALARAIVRDKEFLAVYETSPEGEDLMVFMPELASFELQQKVDHVVDWVVASVVNNAPWLKKVDAAGRPVKLTKLGSLDRAVREADKAMKRNGTGKPIVVTDLDDETYREIGDGWRIWLLKTPQALDAESASMQHCLGEGSYDDLLASGERIFLSLRDPSNRPHVTMEVDPTTNSLLQIQGKQNRLPDSRYMNRLLPFLEELSCDGRLAATGFIQAADGRIHDLRHLPDVLETRSELILDMDSHDARLPRERLVVDGSLYIVSPSGTKVELPPMLHVAGKLRLNGHFVFPDGIDMKVEDMTFTDSTIEGLPSGLSVSGIFAMKDVAIGRLPAGLVLGRLDIVGGDLAELPSDIRIGVLQCHRTVIAKLPDGLLLESLVIETASIVTLPDDLKVVGDATIRDSLVASLGSRMQVGGTLSLISLPQLGTLPADLRAGTLNIRFCDLERITDLSRIQTLRIEGRNPIELPDRISLPGSMEITNATPTVWPSFLSVGGKLMVHGSTDIFLPAGTVVGDTLSLSTEGGTVSIGDGTKVHAATTIHDSSHIVFGSDLDLGKELILGVIDEPIVVPAFAGSGLGLRVFRCDEIEIPDDLDLIDLDITSCLNVRLPRRLVVAEGVILGESTFAAMPEVFEVGKRLFCKRCHDLVIPDGTLVGFAETVEHRVPDGGTVLRDIVLTDVHHATFEDCMGLVIGKNVDIRGDIDLDLDRTEPVLGSGLKVTGRWTGRSAAPLLNGALFYHHIVTTGNRW